MNADNPFVKAARIEGIRQAQELTSDVLERLSYTIGYTFGKTGYRGDYKQFKNILPEWDLRGIKAAMRDIALNAKRQKYV